MGQTIRASLPGYNVLTEANIYRYSLYADSDDVLIKEFARGAGTLALNSTVSINHNLGYIPFYLVFGQVDTGKYRSTNWFSLFSGVWRVRANTTDLIITNKFSASFTGYKYYIFYDQIV